MRPVTAAPEELRPLIEMGGGSAADNGIAGYIVSDLGAIGVGSKVVALPDVAVLSDTKVRGR